MEGLLLDLPCIRWKRFNRKWIDVNWSNYVWITVYLTCLRSFCGQKTTIWPIIGAFKAFKMAIYCILTLHKMDTFQLETDRGKSVKLFSTILCAFKAFKVIWNLPSFMHRRMSAYYDSFYWSWVDFLQFTRIFCIFAVHGRHGTVENSSRILEFRGFRIK